MAVTALEIRHNERGAQHGLGLDRATRDSVATYCRVEWPTNTAKHAARAWDLTLDEARGVVAGRASQATIDKIFKHPNGGWAVVLPVLSAVIGHGVEHFFRAQIQQAAKAAAHAQEHERLALTAYRSLASRSADPRQDRGQGEGAGEVGAPQARSVAR